MHTIDLGTLAKVIALIIFLQLLDYPFFRLHSLVFNAIVDSIVVIE